VALVRRWTSAGRTRPAPGWSRRWRLAVLALADAGVLLWVARELAGRDMPLRVSLLYFPAITVLPQASAAFAVVWGIARTAWAATAGRH
jgi:hypothetical protein